MEERLALFTLRHSRWSRYRVWFAVGAVAAIVTVGLGVGLSRPPGTPPEVLAEVAFRDQRGAPFPVEELAGKVLVLNFVFTRCGSVCPTQTRELAEVERALPDDLRERVRFASVSLDPEYDTPERLRAFAATHGADRPNWFFLASSPGATARLLGTLNPSVAPTSGSASSEEQQRLNHGTAIYLFDRFGRLMQRYLGAPLDRARLGADVARLDRVTSTLQAPSPVAIAAAREVR